MRRAAAVALVAAGALALVSCAPKVAPRIPEGEDYVRPAAPSGAVTPEVARALEKTWRQVLAGEADAAAREYGRIVARHPGLVAAETGLAYARLRAGRLAAAAGQFAAVLERAPDYRPALVGAGSTAWRSGDADGALRYYRRALAVDPADSLVRKRVAALKLQVAERHIAAAQSARDAGDVGTAASELRAALDAAPELAGVRLDLAGLLANRGDLASAVAALEADPTGDRQVSLRRGSLLLADGRYDDARTVYQGLLLRDPTDAEAARGVRAAQEGLDFQAQPEEYRRIASASRVSRADFAALVAVKVTALARLPVPEPRVAVDISASWARGHIATILGLGIMEVYPNHTFQPGAIMRRGDVARAAGRVLDLLRIPSPALATPTDMGPSHLDRDAAVKVVGAGLMRLGADGAFEPWRTLTGREAVEIVEALGRLVGP